MIGLKLMIVEDEKLLLNNLDKILKREIAEVHAFSDPLEALEAYDTIRPDIIMTDIKMPHINGLEMIKRIKEKEASQPFIVLSAFSEPQYFQEAIRLKVENFVTKPVVIDEVIDSIKNIDEKRHQELVMMQQHKMAQMGELLAMIAHQWRQPLSQVSSLLANMMLILNLNEESIKQSAEELDKFLKSLQQYLGQGENIITSLSQIITDFSNFYKVSPTNEQRNINDLLEKTLQIIQEPLKNSKVQSVKEFKSQKKLMLASNEIMQVFMSILQNALDNFASNAVENPKIFITTEDSDEGVTIRIGDNGGGIPKEYLTKLFDPYFSTKADKNGTGIGLYMAKMIIENRHEGKISVQNSDGGALFTIKLYDKDRS